MKILYLPAFIVCFALAAMAQTNAPGIITSEFIYETAPYPE